MNGLGFWVLNGQMEYDLCELKRRPVRRGKGEVPAHLRLYGAENISRAAALIFAIPYGPETASGWNYAGSLHVLKGRDNELTRCQESWIHSGLY